MNFIYFNLLLMIAAFVATFAFSAGIYVLMHISNSVDKNKKPSKIILYPLTALSVGYQVYFWGMWSAFSVAITLKYIQKPEVSWSWLYWVIGLMWSQSLISWFSQKEQQSIKTAEELTWFRRGVIFYSIIAISSYIIFALRPGYASFVYGWVLDILGVSKYLIV